MAYTVRKLITKDLFRFSAILKKLELRLEAGDRTAEQYGRDLIMTALENLHLAEAETAEFLAGLVGITPEELLALPISDTLDIIKQLRKTPDIISFFSSAGTSASQK